MKKLSHGYLYADGHAVIVFEQDVKLGGRRETLEFVEIWERWTGAHLNFEGRLCFSRYSAGPLLDLCKRAERVRATVPSMENGSDSSRKHGVEIGSLVFDFASGGHLIFHDTSILSGGYTYQPEVKEAFDAEMTRWGSSRVVKVHRVKGEVAAVAA